MSEMPAIPPEGLERVTSAFRHACVSMAEVSEAFQQFGAVARQMPDITDADVIAARGRWFSPRRSLREIKRRVVAMMLT